MSVSVANNVMEDVEERAQFSYEIQLERYVDDICTVVPKQRVPILTSMGLKKLSSSLWSYNPRLSSLP